MRRFLLITLGFVILFLALLGIGSLFGLTDEEAIRTWLLSFKERENGKVLLAGVIMGLLWLDLLLPIPSIIIMSTAGLIFGATLGTLIGSAGSLAASLTGFALCRWGGHNMMHRIIGKSDHSRIKNWFEHAGVFGIMISRPIPMLTEILSCLAGLSEMRFRVFFLANVFGTVLTCWLFSYLGSIGQDGNMFLMLGIILAVSALGWFGMRAYQKRTHDDDEKKEESDLKQVNSES